MSNTNLSLQQINVHDISSSNIPVVMKKIIVELINGSSIPKINADLFALKIHKNSAYRN